MFHEAFHADRWAGAFFAVSGENADEVFLCMKALVPPIKSVRGALFGYGASTKLEKILRECPFQGNAEIDPAIEYAIRFICLLVEKNCFRYIDLLLKKIEQMLDEQKGILNLSIESAAALDSGFQDELTNMIRKKTGAADIKMKVSIRPELLGGYCLRYKGYFIDASLKGQLDNMAAELTQTLKGSKAARMGGNDGKL